MCRVVLQPLVSEGASGSENLRPEDRTPAGTGSNTEYVNEDNIRSMAGIWREMMWQKTRNRGTSTPSKFKDREGGRSTRHPTPNRAPVNNISSSIEELDYL